MDVRRVIFLYGQIEEEVYVCQPLRFEDPDYLDKVLKVVKALMVQSSSKNLMYTELEELMHEQVYNDLLWENSLSLKDTSEAERRLIHNIPINMIAGILRQISITDDRTTSHLMDTENPLLKDSDGDDVDVYLYRSMIGSLMYFTSSRPDIMFAVCAYARFQVTPKVSHLHVLKRIFRINIMADARKQTEVATSSMKLIYDSASMFVDKPVVQGKGSTHLVESYYTPTSAPSTSQLPVSPTFSRTTRQESMVPQPRSPTQTLQARRRAKIVVSDDEDDLEDPSKQGRKIAAIDQDPWHFIGNNINAWDSGECIITSKGKRKVPLKLNNQDAYRAINQMKGGILLTQKAKEQEEPATYTAQQRDLYSLLYQEQEKVIHCAKKNLNKEALRGKRLVKAQIAKEPREKKLMNCHKKSYNNVTNSSIARDDCKALQTSIQ
ncbi:hypothetical protein Tco_1157028 [Tanacetum coccineum]